MAASHGKGVSDASQSTDPDQIVAEAARAARRAQRLRDLILGPILLGGGLLLALFWYSLIRERDAMLQHPELYQNETALSFVGMGQYIHLLFVAALIGIGGGARSILRGIGLLRR